MIKIFQRLSPLSFILLLPLIGTFALVLMGAGLHTSGGHVDAKTDTIGSTFRTDKMLDNATLVTPKFASINASSLGDNTLVPAVVGKKIRILSMLIIASAPVTIRLESGAGGTELSGPKPLIASSGFVVPYNPAGWTETGVNTLLNLELGAAVQCGGMVTYIEVD